MLSRPSDGFLDVGNLAGNERLARANFERPIPDWQADMIQTKQKLGKVTIDRLNITYPAAAMAMKSASVIKVSQCFLSAACAAALGCSWPNVYCRRDGLVDSQKRPLTSHAPRQRSGCC